VHLLTPFHLALAVFAPQAPASDPCSRAARFVLGPVDKVANVVEAATAPRPLLHRRDTNEVRVRLRFIVGCDGRAEPASFALTAATDTGYVLTAVALVQASHFAPAMVAGVAVRQIVERELVWHASTGVRAVEFDCPPARGNGSRRALRSVGEGKRPSGSPPSSAASHRQLIAV
jgi:hypothetical protein